jgi:outer membrane protein insertion porin family
MSGLSLFSKSLADSVQQLVIAGTAASTPVMTSPPDAPSFTTDHGTDTTASFDGEGLFDRSATAAVVSPTQTPILHYAADVIDETAAVVPGAAEPPLSFGSQPAIDQTSTHAVPLPPEAVAPAGRLPGTSALPGDPTNPSTTAILSKGGISLAGGYSSLQGMTLEASLVRSGLAAGNGEVSATFKRSGLQTALEFGVAQSDLFDSGVVFGATLFSATRRALGFSTRRNSSPFGEQSNGVKLRLAGKLTESLSLIGHYRLSRDSIRLNNNRAGGCDAILRGSVACSALGRWLNSTAGFALALDRRDDPDNPTRGFRLKFDQDFAGLGGGARYTRPRLEASAHVPIREGISLSLGAEGGLIRSLGGRGGSDAIPIFERFYLGGGDLRGFALRGAGPRVVRKAADGTLLSGIASNTPLGGRAYYRARGELTFALGGKLGAMGIKPALFADLGSVFGAKAPALVSNAVASSVSAPATNGTAAPSQAMSTFTEVLTGNASRPRLTIGAGLGWVTPLGELRFDLAKVVKKQAGDQTQPFAISFGTRF